MDFSSIVSKEILETWLGSAVLDYKVSAGSKPGDNFLSTLYSIEVKTKENENKSPDYLLLKTYPTAEAALSFLTKTNFFYKEVSFYTILLPQFNQFVKEVLGEEAFELQFPNIIAGNSLNWWDTPYGTILNQKGIMGWQCCLSVRLLSA